MDRDNYGLGVCAHGTGCRICYGINFVYNRAHQERVNHLIGLHGGGRNFPNYQFPNRPGFTGIRRLTYPVRQVAGLRSLRMLGRRWFQRTFPRNFSQAQAANRWTLRRFRAVHHHQRNRRGRPLIAYHRRAFRRLN